MPVIVDNSQTGVDNWQDIVDNVSGLHPPSELEILSFELRIVRHGALWIIQFWIDGIKPVFMSSCQKNLSSCQNS